VISLNLGLLFAVHPIHAEAVAGVVGRADILATIFCLLSKHKNVFHLFINCKF